MLVKLKPRGAVVEKLITAVLRGEDVHVREGKPLQE